MYSAIDTEVQNAAKILLNGGIIIYPTETVWGIGCMANNENAIEQIYKIKGRDKNKPLLVLVNEFSMIEQLKKNLSPLEVKWLNHPEPTTVILDEIHNVAPNLVGHNNSLGVRITADEFCKKLIQIIGVPLVSTSANFSGKPAAKTKEELDPELIQKVNYLVNLHPSNTGKASQIVKIVGNELEVIRK